MNNRRPLRSLLLLSALLCLTRVLPAAPYAPPSSDPQELHSFKGYVYFSADDGLHGRELWRGTSKGEVELVADITPGSEGSTISDFAGFGDLMLFRLDQATGGSELWCTDGTAAGTTRITQFDVEGSYHFDELIGIGPDGRAWFRGVGGSTDFWATDGTPEGTKPCAMTAPDGVVVSIDYAGILHQGGLYFSGVHPADGPGLYRYDLGNEKLETLTMLESPKTDFLALGEQQLLFRGAKSGMGLELMTTDGTPEGTTLVLDIAPGPASSFPNSFTLIENSFTPRLAPAAGFSPIPNENARKLVIFSADDGTHGIEPWITDGTGAGTRLVTDVYPGNEGSVAYNYKVYGSRITFQAKGEGTGKELWFTNRPFDTAILLADIYPGPTGSDPYAVVPLFENKSVFSALDPNYGEELFWASATSREARLQMDIYPGADSSYPFWSVALDDRVIFAATDPVHGRELWYVDQEGQVGLLADIYTDASVNPSSSPSQLTPAGDALYFVCNDIEHGTELWVSDGSGAGTRLLKDIFPGPGSSAPQELTPLGAFVYFTAEDGTGTAGLWRTDGTTEGTLPAETDARGPLNLTVLNTMVFFSATRAEEGRELWATGQDRPAALVRDIAVGPASSAPRNLVVFNEAIYFLADDGIHVEELWRSDGTAAGTTMIRDIVSTPFEKIGYEVMAPTAHALFLAAGSHTQGIELWRYSPDAVTLAPVKDLANWDSATVLNPTWRR